MTDETMLPNENQKPQDPSGEEKGSFKLDLYYWTQALVMVLIGLVLVCTLLGRVIRVDGSSMAPTLHDGNLLLLQSLGYTPQQGDVVVLRKPGFPPPPRETAPIVKRVIATGGQHVRVDYAAGAVYVDGVALDEPYVMEAMANIYSSEMTVLDTVVPEGSVYVLGDNRNHSSDSRHQALGTVDERYVLGRVLFVLLPFSDFGTVE